MYNATATMDPIQGKEGSSTDLDKLRHPSAIVKTGELLGITAINAAGRAAELLDTSLNTTQEAVNTVVPATARFASAFFLPEIVGRSISKVAEIGTSIASSVVKGAFSATLQTVTFGLPSWAKMARQAVPITKALDPLRQADSSSEFLARSIAQCSSDSLIKARLLEYVDLRKVQASTDSETSDGERIKLLEKLLKDYREFNDVQAVLNDRASFAQSNFKLINELAHQTTAQLITSTENFYLEQLGWLGSKVEPLSGEGILSTEASKQRELLREKIAQEFSTIFSSDLSAEDVSKSLTKIAGHLHSDFGTYGHALRGGLATLGGAMLYSGTLKDAVLSCVEPVSDMIEHVGAGLREFCSERISAAFRYIRNVSSQLFSTVTQVITDTVNERLDKLIPNFGDILPDASVGGSTYSPFRAEQVQIDPLTGGKVWDCRFGCHSPSSFGTHTEFDPGSFSLLTENPLDALRTPSGEARSALEDPELAEFIDKLRSSGSR